MARDRGPLNLNECPVPFVLSTILSQEAFTQHAAQSFDAGGLVQRSDHLQSRAVDAVVGPSLRLEHDRSLSVERLLFPNDQGTYNASVSFAENLMLRFKSLFSLWTLYKPHLLYMVQMRQALQISKSCFW